MTREQVANALAAYYSAKFKGEVWAGWEDTKRAYFIRGEGLPAAPAMRATYPRGWSLLDFIKPAKARALIAGKQP